MAVEETKSTVIKLNESNKNFSNHKIIIENRKSACITGVNKVDSINPTFVSCQVLGATLLITGTELRVDKLDVSAGNLEIFGNIDSVKYQGEHKNILKRLFK